MQKRCPISHRAGTKTRRTSTVCSEHRDHFILKHVHNIRLVPDRPIPLITIHRAGIEVGGCQSAETKANRLLNTPLERWRRETPTHNPPDTDTSSTGTLTTQGERRMREITCGGRLRGGGAVPGAVPVGSRGRRSFPSSRSRDAAAAAALLGRHLYTARAADGRTDGRPRGGCFSGTRCWCCAPPDPRLGG